MRFYVPHVSVSFGPGGQLVCVPPNSPADGQTALVEVHSMEVINILGSRDASTRLNSMARLGSHFGVAGHLQEGELSHMCLRL